MLPRSITIQFGRQAHMLDKYFEVEVHIFSVQMTRKKKSTENLVVLLAMFGNGQILMYIICKRILLFSAALSARKETRKRVVPLPIFLHGKLGFVISSKSILVCAVVSLGRNLEKKLQIFPPEGWKILL